jgi:hypothetical protein
MTRSLAIVVTLILSGCARAAQQPQVPGGGPAPTAPPAVFAYQPSSTTYRVSSHRTIQQDIQGTTQTTQTDLRLQLAADVVPSDSGLLASFVIDSVFQASLPGVTPADLDRVRGAQFSAALQPSGDLADIGAMASSSQLYRIISNSLSQFFPRIPADGVEGGESWTDTTETMANNGAADITTSSTTENTASHWQVGGPSQVITVTWTATYTFTGAGEQLGQAFTIDGQGRRFGHYRLGADGQYLGGVTADSSTADVLVTGLGITVPVQTVGADTVTIVPE